MTKLTKNPSSRHFCKNFMEDENVLPNKFYRMLLKKISHLLIFFFRKPRKRIDRPKTKSSAKLESRIEESAKSTSSKHLREIFIWSKIIPQTCYMECWCKNTVDISNFFPKNRKNKILRNSQKTHLPGVWTKSLFNEKCLQWQVS